MALIYARSSASNIRGNTEEYWGLCMGVGQEFVGFTAGAFDLLHAGHILMLADCADVCDHLIVGLHVDPSKERATKQRPVETVLERYIRLKGCKYVDEIIPYETEHDLITLLTILPINVRIIGEEYRDKDFSGKKLCLQRGIRIHYNPRRHTFSSTKLRGQL